MIDAVVAFIANGEATKLLEPGERALDDPAEHARPLPWDVRRPPKIATMPRVARRSPRTFNRTSLWPGYVPYGELIQRRSNFFIL